MELDTLLRLWPLVTGLFGAIVAVGVLFYRVSALEKTFVGMSHQDRADHAVIAAKVDALSSTITAVKLDVATDFVTTTDFDRILSRIEDNLDTLNSTLVKALTK